MTEKYFFLKKKTIICAQYKKLSCSTYVHFCTFLDEHTNCMVIFKDPDAVSRELFSITNAILEISYLQVYLAGHVLSTWQPIKHLV